MYFCYLFCKTVLSSIFFVVFPICRFHKRYFHSTAKRQQRSRFIGIMLALVVIKRYTNSTDNFQREVFFEDTVRFCITHSDFFFHSIPQIIPCSVCLIILSVIFIDSRITILVVHVVILI